MTQNKMNAFFKVNDLEYEHIEGKLNEIIEQQQELQALSLQLTMPNKPVCFFTKI